MAKTARFAAEIWVPEMVDDIPGNPRTTASTTTSTITPRTSRMKAGITGVNAPHELLGVESVMFHTFRLESYRWADAICLCWNLETLGQVTTSFMTNKGSEAMVLDMFDRLQF